MGFHTRRARFCTRFASLGLIACGLCGAAHAQFDPSQTPDFSAVLSRVGGTASAPAGSSSGLSIPTVNPGEAAKDAGRQLEAFIASRGGKGDAMAKAVDKMGAYVSDLEGQIEKIGFAKRDMGVAVAFAVLFQYEAATGKTVPDAPSRAAARRIIAAVAQNGKSKFAALSPSEKERVYETLLTQGSLLHTLVPTFARAGRTVDAAQFRANAAQIFTRLTGKLPQDVTFTEDGRIVGLGGTSGGRVASSSGRRTSVPAPPDTPIRRVANPAQLDSVILHFEMRGGVGGGMYGTYSPYVLLKDGRITYGPDEALDEWDTAAYQRKHPTSWGKWRRSGTTLNIQWGDGKSSTWTTKQYFTGRPAPASMKLSGSYRTVGGGGNSSLGGDLIVFVSKDFNFAPNGTFTYEGTAGAMSPNLSVGNNRTQRGTYKISGYAISVRYADGKTKRGFFYRYPDSDEVLGMFGSEYTKR